MAPKDDAGRSEQDLELSLRLPSFGRRKRKRTTAEEPPQEPVAEPAAAEPEPVAEPEPEPIPVAPATVDDDAADGPGVPEEPAAEAEAPAAEESEGPSAAAALVARVRAVDLPRLSANVAVPVTGVITGVLGVVLGGIALRLCSVVQGTGSCGRGVLLMMIGTLVVTVIVGARLLRAWEVEDPASTSFLALGLVALIALVFLIDAIFSWVMLLVVPILSALMFVLSHYLTNKLSVGVEGAEPDGR